MESNDVVLVVGANDVVNSAAQESREASWGDGLARMGPETVTKRGPGVLQYMTRSKDATRGSWP